MAPSIGFEPIIISYLSHLLCAIVAANLRGCVASGSRFSPSVVGNLELHQLSVEEPRLPGGRGGYAAAAVLNDIMHRTLRPAGCSSYFEIIIKWNI